MRWPEHYYAIAAEHPRLSYGEIAAARGLTRGQVAGIIGRVRRPKGGRHVPPPPRLSKYDGEVLEILADGRERTTCELARAMGAPDVTGAWKVMHRLERAGVVRCTRLGRGGAPSFWVEVDEDRVAA